MTIFKEYKIFFIFFIFISTFRKLFPRKVKARYEIVPARDLIPAGKCSAKKRKKKPPREEIK